MAIQRAWLERQGSGIEYDDNAFSWIETLKLPLKDEQGNFNEINGTFSTKQKYVFEPSDVGLPGSPRSQHIWQSSYANISNNINERLRNLGSRYAGFFSRGGRGGRGGPGSLTYLNQGYARITMPGFTGGGTGTTTFPRTTFGNRLLGASSLFFRNPFLRSAGLAAATISLGFAQANNSSSSSRELRRDGTKADETFRHSIF